MSYYVEPEYWIEGYAEGDAKSAAAEVVISSNVLALSNVVSNVSSEISCVFSVANVGTNIVRDASSNIFAAFAVSSSGAKTSTARGQISLLSETLGSTQIIRQVMTQIPIQCMFDANAELKWSPTVDTVTNWSDAQSASTHWVDA